MLEVKKALNARQAIKSRAQAPLLFRRTTDLQKHSYGKGTNDTIAIENLVITG
jgi:hypothetical protein